jgi:hypothetical protein
MQTLVRMLHDGARRDVAGSLWRSVGRRLLLITIAVLVAIGLVHVESWAIRQAPMLIASPDQTYSQDAGCVPDDNADDGMLPVAVLH